MASRLDPHFEAIKSRIQAGESTESIARDFPVSRVYICQYMRSRGFEIGRGVHRQKRMDQLRLLMAISDCLERGLTHKETAKAVGVKLHTVTYWTRDKRLRETIYEATVSPSGECLSQRELRLTSLQAVSVAETEMDGPNFVARSRASLADALMIALESRNR